MRFPIRKAFTVAVLCAVTLLASSCASLQRSWDQGAIRQVADLINAGDAQKLAAMSLTPFILDGEVVVLPADVAGFWSGILKAGFRVEAAALDNGTKVSADSYRQFADTMEVRSYFARYVKDDTRILDLTTGSGSHLRLLMRNEWFSWKILGWKGPF
jgi:hypothetical protein